MLIKQYINIQPVHMNIASCCLNQCNMYNQENRKILIHKIIPADI